MSRTKKTQLLAIVSALNLLCTSFFSIILGRMVLVHLGSEYNAINAIVSQFLMVIAVLEGGFTTASLVAMMKPYAQKDSLAISQLFAETTYKFNRIGLLSLGVGVVSAVVYGYFVETTIYYWTVVAVLLIGLLTSIYNMGILTKYRLVFQVAQDEHVYGLATLGTTVLGQVGMIVMLVTTKNIIFVRLAHMIVTLFSGAIVARLAKKRYPLVQKTIWDGTKRIQGTKDVFVGKIVSTIHSSSTILFLSIFSNAALTSVYAVYNSVIHTVVSLLNIGITSPQNALGQVLQTDESNTKKKIVLEFEYTAILILTVIFVPLSVLIVPFVKIYTQGVTDVEYVNYLLAFLMVLAPYFQLIHIPAGLCIYMSGKFKTAKVVQELALVLLLLGNIILGNLFGMYGFLASVILCNLALAIAEISYVHMKLLKGTMHLFFLRWIPNALLTVGMIFVFHTVFSPYINGILSWIFIAAAVTLTTVLLTVGANLLLLRQPFLDIVKRVLGTLLKKRKKSIS